MNYNITTFTLQTFDKNATKIVSSIVYDFTQV